MAIFSNNWFEPSIQPWQRLFDELEWRDGRPITAVEIGSFEGRSTLWTIENLLQHPDSRIHCIDTFEGGIEHTERERHRLRARFDANIAGSAPGFEDKVAVHQALSRHALVDLLRDGVRADFVYIDGSHQAPDVLEDLVLSFRLLAIGGLVICDDYLWFQEHIDGRRPGTEDLLNAPKLAIDAFVNIYIRRIRIIESPPLGQFAFLKIAD